MTAVAKQLRTDKDAAPVFELRILPIKNPKPNQPPYRLALWQRTIAPSGSKKPKIIHIVTIGKTPLQLSLDQMLDALKIEGYRANILQVSRQEPIELHEEIGVRLALLFLALKPLSKVARMESIAAGIRSMSVEETYYWFSKCTMSKQSSSALRAFRILLAPE